MDQTIRSRTRTRTIGIATIIAGVAITTLVPAAWSRGLRGDARQATSKAEWAALADAGAEANAPMTLLAAADGDTPRGTIRNVDKRPDNVARILGGQTTETSNATGSPTPVAPVTPMTPDAPTAPVDTGNGMTIPLATETPAAPAATVTESSDTTSYGNSSSTLPEGVVSDAVPNTGMTEPLIDVSDDTDASMEDQDGDTEFGFESGDDSGSDVDATDCDDMDNDLTPGTARMIPMAGPNAPVQKASGEQATHLELITPATPSNATPSFAQAKPAARTELLPLQPISSTPAPVFAPKASTPAPSMPIRPAVAPIAPSAPVAPMMVAQAQPLHVMPPQASPVVPSSHSSVEADTKFISSVKINPLASNVITLTKSASAVLELHGKVDRVEIANPQVASVFLTTPSRVVVVGRGLGVTELSIQMGEQERVLSVSVEMDLRPLRDMIMSIAPGSRVTPRTVNGTIVLTGTVPDSSTAERLGELAALYETGKVQNQLRVAGVQQTQLRCMVAEVNKRALRQLGVNWAAGGSDWTRDIFFANNIGQLNPTQIGSSGVANVLNGQQIYSIGAAANGGTTNFTLGFPRAELQFFINALRENQLFRILAEPNLTAISGQTAMFLAGGEVPIPVTQGGATAGAVTIEYKEFGVRLHFTPTVVGGQLIRLHVMSEYSDAIPGATIAGGLPTFSFTTRRVESTVECGNGQTFAIAGLLSERVRAVSSKIPALGDIPVLGALFSSVEYQKDNSELVILVTPELVQALDPHQVGPAPGALMTDPSDAELFGMGLLEGPENERPGMDRVPRHEQEPMVQPPTGGPVRGACAGRCGGACGECRRSGGMHGPTGPVDCDE